MEEIRLENYREHEIYKQFDVDQSGQEYDVNYMGTYYGDEVLENYAVLKTGQVILSICK